MYGKKLYKVDAGKKVCGVCGGIAKYLNLDVNLVRVLWAVLSVFYGVAIVLYIVLAFVLPSENDIID